MDKQFMDFLGIGARAGKLVWGQSRCLEQLRRGALALVVLDGSVSCNTRQRFCDAAEARGTPVVPLSGLDVLGPAIGRPGNKIVGINDAQFAQIALAKYNKTSGGEPVEQD